MNEKHSMKGRDYIPSDKIKCALISGLILQRLYSGNQLMSTPRDWQKVLTLNEVDLIRIQRHIVKYSQVSSGVTVTL